ncbi:MAG TPA: cytochrome b5 domain-containing protein [Candidatus Sulfotelmatobacter sp.]|nr:cytochrome b5 domain-containing protein [Candidatus Sulfotelmatobacter sp.]
MSQEQRKITMAEVAQNNGQNGKPAFIVYKGKVYDVSESAFWLYGEHMSAHLAGKDLTSEMEMAPHREETLQRVKEVGVLADSAT